MENFSATVELNDGNDNLCINNLCTSDPEICGYFADIPSTERAVLMETAIKLGITALKTMSTAEKVDYIEKNFKQMTTEIKQQLNVIFGQDGKVVTVIDKYFGEKGHVATYLDAKLGKNGDFSRLIESQFGPNGEIAKNIFDPNKEGTPLHSLRKEILDSLQKLRTDIGIKGATDEIKEKTALKGMDFQTDLLSIFEGIVRPFGDVLEDVSSIPGKLGRSKKGDFLVTISNTEKKFVIEAKDAEYSIKDIDKEMKEAIENRGAEFGIFVSKYLEDLPSSVGWFNEYGGRYLVIALATKADESLQPTLAEIAYKWVRIKSLLAIEESKNTIKSLDIRGDIVKIGDSISRFRNIRTNCTSAEKAISSIENELKEIEREVKGSLDTVLSALT